VRGGTEAINLVAQAWGRQNIGEGDEIVITWLEHHANIVPWFRLCEETGARLRVAPVDDRGQIVLHEYARLLGPKTKDTVNLTGAKFTGKRSAVVTLTAGRLLEPSPSTC
jgi:selenocysteine lyase/cysteine desulfurase